MSEGTLVDQTWNVGNVKVRFCLSASTPLEGERWLDLTPVVEAVEKLVSDWLESDAVVSVKGTNPAGEAT